MSIVSFRIDADKLAKIDKAAKRDGLSRTAWLKIRIERDIRDIQKSRPANRANDDDIKFDRHVKVRLNKRQFAALEVMAINNGLFYADVAKMIVLARLYQGHLKPVSLEASIIALNNYKNEIRKIGVNVNQVTRKLHMAIDDNDAQSFEFNASYFLSSLQPIKDKLSAAQKHINDVMYEDYHYWRGHPIDLDEVMKIAKQLKY